MSQTRLCGKLQKDNVGHLFERIAMDLAELFLMSQRGNRHSLVVANYFSKWCETYPVPTIDATDITKVYVDNWILHYDVTLELYSDQGRNFKLNLFSEMCKLFQLTRSELQHSIHNHMEWWSNWTGHLQHLSKIIWWTSRRLGPLYSTFYVGIPICNSWEYPAYCSKGDTNPWIEIAMWFGIWNTTVKLTPVNKFVMEMRNRLRRTYITVRKWLCLTLDQMKTRHDIRANSPRFFVGDHTWLYNPAYKKGHGPKLRSDGPDVIIKPLDWRHVSNPETGWPIQSRTCRLAGTLDWWLLFWSWIRLGHPTLRNEPCYT